MFARTALRLITPVSSSELELTPDNEISAGSIDGISVSVSVYGCASVAVPPPVHRGSSRPRSCSVSAEEWVRVGESETSSADRPTTQPPAYGVILKTRQQAHDAAMYALAPLTPTTRLLNGVAEVRTISPPTSLSPIEMLAERRRAAKPKPFQKRRSCSPLLGPSPLRNSFILESFTSLPVVESSRPGSTVVSVCPSWELEDLLVDGRLDVNAVSAALGLGLSMASNEAIGDYDSGSAELNFSNRANGDASTGFLTTSTSFERARESSPITLPVHMPGAQLFAIPEEVEDVLSVDVSMRGSMHSRSTGIRFSDIDADFLADLASASTMLSIPGGHRNSGDCREEILWEDEERWRGIGDTSGSIGEAC
ncbi:uncharacterized protein B0H18DRAFT_197704 [Fomitopsis serialis]|uniref:uncharacterized protein n=1 Tax=Fomitopsis serialis TaxID=139415 RepID=UPI0020074B92|nr:uncharacterized protein B0H18DRAFT_197704 [Neoantrodia serialis]KAH9937437.1 hypothetical protein B0H18DRAFT_197704 [Neoantrodia serialis]